MDTISAHGAEQVVDLRRVGTTTQDDHFNLRVVDVRDVVTNRLDVVDPGLDEVLHVQVDANRAAERLLAVVEHFELYRRREQTSEVDRVGIVGDRRLVQLRVEAMLRFIIDEHLDSSARVIERADDVAIIEVSCIRLQVGDDDMHLQKEGVHGQREQEAG